MKAMKRFCRILRMTGVVLVIVALVFALYSMLNTGKPWGSLSTRMNQEGVQTGFIDRLLFDDRVLSALSDAVSTKSQNPEQRAAALEKYFAAYTEKVSRKLQADEQTTVEDFYRWLEEDFDPQAFLARYELMDGNAESQQIREIFEYIDSISPAPRKGKVANLVAASLQPWFEEYYQAFSAEHGEEVGTWYEFISTVKLMLQDDGSVKDVKTWMSDTFTYEAYQQVLPQVLNQEANSGSENILDDLAAQCEKELAGEKADFRGLMQDTLAGIVAKYPQEADALNREAVFASSLRELLEEDSFDGSYAAIATKMREENAAASKSGFAAFMKEYTTALVTDADARSSVKIIGLFWAVVAKYLLILLIGIALIILAKVIDRMFDRHLLRNLESAGIQEDPSILLRVEHLKQYFRSGDFVAKAVDDVNFFVKKGEVFGLVGESGCGKTTTGRTIINLYDPTEGDVYFEGMRISSSLNGLPVLKKSLQQDLNMKLAGMKEAMKEEIRQHPDQANVLREKLNEQEKHLKAELKKQISEAETRAIESSVEKSKCTQMYRERRQAELTEAYEKDLAAGLSGPALEERRRRYKTEMKVAKKDNVMTRMQMIFQDPIASINPRMTVREIIAEGLIIQGVKDKDYINQKVYEMLELVGLVPEHADRYPHEFSGGQRQRIGIARAIVMRPDLIIADEPISALDVSIQAQVINLLNDLRNSMGLTIIFIAHNLSVVKYFSDRIAVMYYGKIVELADCNELFRHPLHPYTKSLLSAIPYPDPHYERSRVRIEYNPRTAHDYSKDKPSMREIIPGHFIYCNDAELERYKKEIGD